MRLLKFSLFLGVFMLGHFLVQAQSFLGWQYNDRYFSVNLGTGKSGYNGDLSHGKVFQKGLSTFHVGLEARLYSRISAKAELTYFNISGNDDRAPAGSFEQQRNLSFSGNNLEYSLSMMYYFLNPYGGKYYKRKPVDPYLSIGVAALYFNPTAELDGETYQLRRYQTENVRYGTIAMAIPIGLGAKLSINEFINLIPEIGYRYGLTDYLDDVSGQYGGPYTNATAAALSNRKEEIEIVNRNAFDLMVPDNQRGDATKRDDYYFISVRVECYLPPDLFSSRKNKQHLYKKPSAFDKL